MAGRSGWFAQIPGNGDTPPKSAHGFYSAPESETHPQMGRGCAVPDFLFVFQADLNLRLLSERQAVTHVACDRPVTQVDHRPFPLQRLRPSPVECIGETAPDRDDMIDPGLATADSRLPADRESHDIAPKHAASPGLRYRRWSSRTRSHSSSMPG